MTNEELREGFIKIYGDEGEIRGYMSPGRVNLIGEHIDYNGGHVFPCALKNGNYAVVRKRDDRKLRFYSANYHKGGVYETSLDDLRKHDYSWTNYPLGVIWALKEKGFEVTHGFDIYIWGNIPGSGLSSSAAMEVVIGTMLKDYFDFDITPIDIALAGQRAENDFIGMNCGIMDQFASAMGKENKAIFLDCATLDYQYVPLDLKGYKIIVSNSNKPHSLVTSHYNDRRKECEQALADLQSVVKVDALCHLTVAQFEQYKSAIKDEFCLRRAKHAVYEEERTKEAVEALKRDDLVTFGRLLNESGDSLKYDYDATCFEIDTLVELARKQVGVLGSRETGGGWGGNTVSIVKDEDVAAFKANVSKSYKAITGLDTSIYELEVGEGGRRLF